MKTPRGTTSSIIIVGVALFLGALAGCHGGLDGVVPNTEGFHIGDLLGPAPAGPASPARPQDEGSEDDRKGRGGEIAPPGPGPVRGVHEDDPAAPAAEARGETVANVIAFTCDRLPNDELCWAYRNADIDAPRMLVVSWTFTNIRAALLHLPKLDDGIDRFLFTEFIGDIDRPYAGAPGGPDGLLDDPLSGFDALPADILAAIADESSLPFSYCETVSDIEAHRCFNVPYDGPKEQVIFFPLRPGETGRSGKWLLSINGDEPRLPFAYADLENNVNLTKVPISRPPVWNDNEVPGRIAAPLPQPQREGFINGVPERIPSREGRSVFNDAPENTPRVLSEWTPSR